MPGKHLTATAWAEVPLSEVGTLIRGRGGSKADAVDNGIPCIRYGDLYTQHDNVVRDIQSFVAASRASAYTELQFGDVVFAGSGETFDEIGKAAAFCGTQPAVTSGDTIVLRPGQHADGRFLGYAANSNSANKHKSRMGQGSSVFHISATHIGQYRLPLPPLPEQTAIAAVLDTIDDAIRKTEQIIAKLQQVKQGLLHALLTRGIDDNGELRDPERHPEQFQDSALGRIPKGWEVAPVGSLLADVDPAMRSGPFGSALLKHELVATGVPLLGIDNVHVERFVSSYERFVTPQKARELSRYFVRPRDVMITIMGTVGRCCVVPEGVGEALSSKHVWTLTFDEGRYPAELACLQFNHAPWVLRHFARDEQGGIMAAIRSETLRSALLPVPSPVEARRIASVLTHISRRISEEVGATAKLKLLKAGLAEDLLTGRVRTTSLPEVAA